MKLFYELSLFFILFEVSCTSQNSVSAPTKKAFRYNQHSNISSLDPAFARSQANLWAIDHLYNGLVQLDNSAVIRPCIAKSWKISDDGLCYTFHLRNDVFFHDSDVFLEKKGRKLIAKDIAYSFNRIMDDQLASPGSWVFKGKIAEREPFQAVDDTTFLLRLNSPFRPMLGILSMAYCSVVPQEAVKKYGSDFRKNPVGTGAFRFKKWLENQTLFLEKNNNYFECDSLGNRFPYLDGVKISFISERKTAFLELLKGNLDYLNGLESSYATELLDTKGNLRNKYSQQLKLIKSPYLNTEYLGIKIDKQLYNPLQIKKLRQALNYGFDRKTMLKTMRNNVGIPAFQGFLPPGLPSFDASAIGYSYQPEKAAKLLLEAGFSDKNKMSEVTLLVTKDYLDLCTFIVRQWEELGIKATIELSENATLRERMAKGDAPFFRASWIADYPDAESFFTVFYSKNPAPPNYTHFSNANFDLLYEKLVTENDDNIRNEICHKLDKILMEESPVIFLFYDQSAVFLPPSISGLQPNCLNVLSLKTVRKD